MSYMPYRYVLGRRGARPLVCIGINPSTAPARRAGPPPSRAWSGWRRRTASTAGSCSTSTPQRATDPNDMDAVPDRALCDENLPVAGGSAGPDRPHHVGGLGHPDRKAALPAGPDAGDGGPHPRKGDPPGSLSASGARRGTPTTRCICARTRCPSPSTWNTTSTPAFERKGGGPMRPDRYAVIYRWFAARPAALTALRLANRWLPPCQRGGLRPFAGLAGRASGCRCRRYGPAGPRRLGCRARSLGAAACCGPFWDRPRPTQQPGFVPLLPKETPGPQLPVPARPQRCGDRGGLAGRSAGGRAPFWPCWPWRFARRGCWRACTPRPTSLAGAALASPSALWVCARLGPLDRPKRYNPYNFYKMNTPSGAGGGSKTVEIVAFVEFAGGGRTLDIPARLLYTKHRKGAAGQTVVPLSGQRSNRVPWEASGYFFLLFTVPLGFNQSEDYVNNSDD